MILFQAPPRRLPPPLVGPEVVVLRVQVRTRGLLPPLLAPEVRFMNIDLDVIILTVLSNET